MISKALEILQFQWKTRLRMVEHTEHTFFWSWNTEVLCKRVTEKEVAVESWEGGGSTKYIFIFHSFWKRWTNKMFILILIKIAKKRRKKCDNFQIIFGNCFCHLAHRRNFIGIMSRFYRTEKEYPIYKYPFFVVGSFEKYTKPHTQQRIFALRYLWCGGWLRRLSFWVFSPPTTTEQTENFSNDHLHT